MVWIFRPPEGVEAVSDLRSGDVFSPFNRREVHAAVEATFGRVEMGRVGTFAPVGVVDASFFRIDSPDVHGDLPLDEGDSQDSLDQGEASFAAWGAYKGRVTAPRPDDPSPPTR